MGTGKRVYRQKIEGKVGEEEEKSGYECTKFLECDSKL